MPAFKGSTCELWSTCQMVLMLTERQPLQNNKQNNTIQRFDLRENLCPCYGNGSECNTSRCFICERLFLTMFLMSIGLESVHETPKVRPAAQCLITIGRRCTLSHHQVQQSHIFHLKGSLSRCCY